MARWEPDARGRMMAAALDLFSERGFEQTTAADIAARAGVTERTFFRHFADKREVLFVGSELLESAVVDGIASAPADAAPLDAAVAGFRAGAELLERDRAVRRAAVIAAHPALQERELLKMAALASAAAQALRARGVADPAATLAADSGAAVFRSGFEAWIAADADADPGDCVEAALGQLRATLGG